MDLTADFISRILSLAPPTVFSIGEKKYTCDTRNGVMPVYESLPQKIEVDTLTGIVDFIQKSNYVNPAPNMPMILHVATHSGVTFQSSPFGAFAQTACLASATAFDCKFPFNTFMRHEDFVIAAQTHFIQDNPMGTVLKVVGNLKDGEIKNVIDDGVSQTVKAKTGITRVEEIDIKNPVVLRPYRTFLEVDQPTSPFILRLKSGGQDLPQVALFEADGGRWKLKAMQSIAEHLAFELADMVREKKVVVLA